MLVIGKVSLLNQERRINNKNNAPSLRRNEIQDSVSFKAFEDLFIQELKLLRTKGWTSHLAGKIQVIARGVNPNDKAVLAEIDSIKRDNSAEKPLLHFVNEVLPPLLGAGGLKKL